VKRPDRDVGAHSSWQLGPFTRVPRPVLHSTPDFGWASKDVFNPGAVVRDSTIHLLVRGEDRSDQYAGVSRIGLAVSTDAARVDGRFWMYWGEGTCFTATSEDLVHWSPLHFDATGDRYLTYDGSWKVHPVRGQQVLRPVLFPRRQRFDSILVEPGPPAVLIEAGVVLIYNGANHPESGDPALPPLSYQPGQALFDSADPTACIARPMRPFLEADTVDERAGQVANVCFAQALVLYEGEWRLYFGMADSTIGCATAPV
jgi:predicted GH43/DUF377 family glycosyl hydrolase